MKIKTVLSNLYWQGKFWVRISEMCSTPRVIHKIWPIKTTTFLAGFFFFLETGTILSGHAKSQGADDYGVHWPALAIFQMSSLGLLDVAYLIFNIFDSSFCFTITVTIPLFKKTPAINK